MLFPVFAGCSWDRHPESTPPVCEQQVAAAPVCPQPPEPTPGPAASEMLDLKNKCFQALNDREATVEELRREVQDLRQELDGAHAETDDWRERLRAISCD